jgi:hypothetical protein
MNLWRRRRTSRGALGLVGAYALLPGLVATAWTTTARADEGRAPAAPSDGGARSRAASSPGPRITISVDGQPGKAASYRWVQVEGPSVQIDDPTKPEIRVTIPEGSHKLGFLVSRTVDGVEATARVDVPVERIAPADPSAPRADAGDDQVGLVGSRITLNGSLSRPRGAAVFRWFPLSGPKVEEVAQEGHYYSFMPTAAGVYRFGLVVAAVDSSGDVAISEMDEVVVSVGTLPAQGAAAGSPAAALDQILHGPGGASVRATVEQAAGVFDAIAAKATLYTTFADLSSEMMRRLDAIVPTDPNWRDYWSRGVFAPMSQYIAAEMLPSGLDLRTPQGQQQALTAQQQDALQKLFARCAKDFRSRTLTR